MKKKLITFIIFFNILLSLFGLWIMIMENDGSDYKLINAFKGAIEKDISSEITVEIHPRFFKNNVKFMDGNQLVHNLEIDNFDAVFLLVILIFNIVGFIFWILVNKKLNNNL